MKNFFVLLMASFVFFISCGEKGPTGKDGKSCTAVDNEDGTVTIVCDDGTEITIGASGKDGKDGAAGDDGKDGDDGEQGEKGDNGEDGKTILVSMEELEPDTGECPAGGYKITVCTDDGEGRCVEDTLHEEIVCHGEKGEDGKEGEEGEKGEDGKDGENGTCYGATVPEITIHINGEVYDGETVFIMPDETNFPPDVEVTVITDKESATYSISGSNAVIKNNGAENIFTISFENSGTHNFNVIVTDGCHTTVKSFSVRIGVICNKSFYVHDIETLTDVMRCDFIGGDLEISNTYVENILLKNLKMVWGTIRIYDNYNLKTFAAPLLEEVGDYKNEEGYFEINSNPELETISLPNLKIIGRAFIVNDNKKLSGINADKIELTGKGFKITNNGSDGELYTLDFPSLIKTGGRFEINSNNNLISFSANSIVESDCGIHFISNKKLEYIYVNELKKTGASFKIESNPALKGFFADNFETSGGGFVIRYNNVLTQFSADSLESTSRGFRIEENESLTHFSAAKLKEINCQLSIYKNENLEIFFLDALQTVSNHFYIGYNSKLPTSMAEALYEQLANNPSFDIEKNMECPHGYIFNDEHNCILDIWTDPETDLLWTNLSEDPKTWADAREYCLNLGGDWDLPTISTLRTLVKKCGEAMYPKPEDQEPWCKVTDECLTVSCWTSAACQPGCSGEISVVGDNKKLWSLSENPEIEGQKWWIDFNNGDFGTSPSASHYFRCVSL